MPTEWDLHYPDWMICDGEQDREVSESFEWFAVEFWTREPLSRSAVRAKTATPIPDYRYRVTGEIVYLSNAACILDFGLRAIETPDAVLPDCKQGDYVTGEIGIGLPLCVEMVPEEILETLKRKWHVNSISADLTQFISRPESPRFFVRDETRIRYVDSNSTRAVTANSYVLHCTVLA